MTTVDYSIPSIHCNHCAHTITMELQELEGVKSVQVSPDSKRAVITFEDPANEEKIKALLAEIAYPVVN
jgi:copper chaperone